MATRRLAWVLNLDADLELAAPRAYAPKQSVREAMKPWASLLAASLVGPDDAIVDESAPPLSAKGLTGRAFCPTPRAIALLERAGALPEPHPSVDVLRRVNSRAFAASLGETLPAAAFVTELDAARAKLAGAPPLGDGWRIKRNFGMTGRGQRVVRAATSVSDADLAFVRAGLAEGGVQIEPNVAIVAEYAVHGMLDERGSLALGRLVRQQCDARGAWVSTVAVASPTPGELAISDALAAEAERASAALTREGYFGPFGVDAYTYRGEGDRVALQVRSEINARYSMGFAAGFSR
ncbi:MAG: hypothetical protein JWP87_5378 [Labilithrix sp.]|nr:hypothetical protein [Labilithrix sp.]